MEELKGYRDFGVVVHKLSDQIEILDQSISLVIDDVFVLQMSDKAVVL